jgi:hypothetical protein
MPGILTALIFQSFASKLDTSSSMSLIGHKLTLAKAEAVQRTMAPEMTEAERHQMADFYASDRNGDGALSIQEIRDMIVYSYPPHEQADQLYWATDHNIRDEVGWIDTNGDDRWSEQEVLKVVRMQNL